MSLINDALKRARENQPRTQPPAEVVPPLEPATPPPTSDGSGTKFVLYLMILCVAVGNVLLFVYASRRQAEKLAAPEAAAGTVATSPAAPAADEPQPAATAAPVPSAPLAPPVAAIPAQEPARPESVVTDLAAPVVAAPQPAPLRLQSVILGGQRSSAMISGKVLFLGDRIQGWQVAAIAGEEVTLVRDGQTNVLALP